MSAEKIKLRITRPTAIEGTPVEVGEIVEVSYDIAMALRRVSEPVNGPEQIQHGDPSPEARDPKAAKKR